MILGGSFFLAIYMTLTPALSKPYMQALTKDNKMYIGHGNTLGLFLGGSIGKLVGKMEKGKFKSAEDIKFPK
jgi:PTS system ascorbate-specific IIC component